MAERIIEPGNYWFRFSKEYEWRLAEVENFAGNNARWVLFPGGLEEEDDLLEHIFKKWPTAEFQFLTPPDEDLMTPTERARVRSATAYCDNGEYREIDVEGLLAIIERLAPEPEENPEQ